MQDFTNRRGGVAAFHPSELVPYGAVVIIWLCLRPVCLCTVCSGRKLHLFLTGFAYEVHGCCAVTYRGGIVPLSLQPASDLDILYAWVFYFSGQNCRLGLVTISGKVIWFGSGVFQHSSS